MVHTKSIFIFAIFNCPRHINVFMFCSFLIYALVLYVHQKLFTMNFTINFFQWTLSLLCSFPLTFPDHCFNFSPKIFTFIIFILSQFCHFITLILQSNLSFLLNNSFTQMFHHISWWFFFSWSRCVMHCLCNSLNVLIYSVSFPHCVYLLFSCQAHYEYMYARMYVCVYTYIYLIN